MICNDLEASSDRGVNTVSHLVNYAILCRPGYGNVIGLPTFAQTRSGGTQVASAQLVLTSAVSGPAAVGRLAVGNPRGPWRITDDLEIPMGRSHVTPLQPSDEVASLVLRPGPQRTVTMSVVMSVTSALTVGATCYPVLPYDFYGIPFGQSVSRPGVLLCCDFGPLDGLELLLLDRAGVTVSTSAGPWPTGRTLVPLPQSAMSVAVSYKPERRELGPPASVVLQWLSGSL